ncbi:MAG: IS1380 family transposase [Planctomycetota bacterium]
MSSKTAQRGRPDSPDSPRQGVIFSTLTAKPVHAVFDEPDTTSDGGALLLKAADRRLGLTKALAGCLEDARRADRIDHTLHDLFRQRIYGLALGYEDANDAARVGSDPMHKLLLDRDPLAGASLASQPTLSRFENGVDRRGLFALGECLADTVLDRLQARRKHRAPRRVTIDLDPTCDPTHGRQQLSFFHGFYDTHCYLPMLAFVTLDDEPESFLVAAVLRSGRAPDKEGAIGILRRLIGKVRSRFPRTRVRVRLDAGFMAPEILDLLDRARVEYLVGYANNERLAQKCAGWTGEAQRRYEQRGEPVQVFGELSYAARKWKGKSRRLIVKAEVVEAWGREPKVNLRFVVTNLRHKPHNVYAIYCWRGEIENRVKELKASVALDRTSCSDFFANQLRALLAAAAYAILQELRSRLKSTELARAQVQRLRLCLLRIGARIVRSVRRIVVHLAAAHGWQPPWSKVAVALGAHRC